MSKLRLFAKVDIKVVEAKIKAGQEVRIGKIRPDWQEFMVICCNDNLHKWCSIKEYNNLIEDRLVEDE